MQRLILDLDGTLAESRQKISPAMKKVLQNYECIVISGAEQERMEYQLDGLECMIFSQSGNITPFWKRYLSTTEIDDILQHAYEYMEGAAELENRGAQMTVSMTGFEADKKRKHSYDPHGDKRLALLEKHPFISSSLVAKIAGTTSIDYYRKDGTKGENIKRYLKKFRLNPRDFIYIGDKLFPGGNDESVVGILPTLQVNNPNDTLKFLL